MKTNTTIPLGSIILVEKVEKRFDLFSKIFSGVGGKAEDFIECVKLHVYNKMTRSISLTNSRSCSTDIRT